MSNREEKKAELEVSLGGDCSTGAYAIRTDCPFVTTKKELKRNPPTPEMIERSNYIRTHDFCLIYDPDKHTSNIIVTPKE